QSRHVLRIRLCPTVATRQDRRRRFRYRRSAVHGPRKLMTMRRKLRDQIYENILSSLSVDDFILRFEKYISSGYHPDDAYEATENDWASIKGKRNYKSIQVFAKARYAW